MFDLFGGKVTDSSQTGSSQYKKGGGTEPFDARSSNDENTQESHDDRSPPTQTNGLVEKNRGRNSGDQWRCQHYGPGMGKRQMDKSKQIQSSGYCFSRHPQHYVRTQHTTQLTQRTEAPREKHNQERRKDAADDHYLSQVNWADNQFRKGVNSSKCSRAADHH
nr:hypothetical protein [Phyllobacterium sp. KW56]